MSIPSKSNPFERLAIVGLAVLAAVFTGKSTTWFDGGGVLRFFVGDNGAYGVAPDRLRAYQTASASHMTSYLADSAAALWLTAATVIHRRRLQKAVAPAIAALASLGALLRLWRVAGRRRRGFRRPR
jgi:hypothetical protein